MLMITCDMVINGKFSKIFYYSKASSTMPTETPSAESSSSNSPLTDMPSCMTIMVSDLSRALDKMGASDEHVSATKLYRTIFEMKPSPRAEVTAAVQSE